MKTKNMLLLCSALLSFTLFPSLTHAAEWAWAEHFGGSAGGLIVRDVHVDASGNSYVTGLFGGTVDFGNVTLQPTGLTSIFVAKIDVDGNVIWANRAGGWSFNEGYGIVADSAGNVYVTGSFQEFATFGSLSISSAGGNDAFLAKYSSSGDIVWVTSGGGSGNNISRAVAVDSGGNPYITGSFGITASFGGIPVISAGGSDIFVASYTSDGDIRWAVRAGSTGAISEQEGGRAIAVNDSGDVFVAGHFNGSASFGGQTLLAAGNQDVFVAKLDPVIGSWDWAVRGGGTGNDVATRLALDPDGNPVVAGYFAGTANFGGVSLVSEFAGGNGLEDFFLAKYDTDGGLLWIQKTAGTGGDRSAGLTVDGAGNIYFAGAFQGTVTVGDEVLVSDGYQNVYIARFNSFGTPDWALLVPGNDELAVGGLGSDSVGNVIVGGAFFGVVEFGEMTLTQSGGFDGFIAKLQLADDPDPEEDDVTVFVDFVIRPGSDVNPFNRRSRGVLPAAILGSEELNVMDIDVLTLSIWRADGVGGVVAPLSFAIEEAEGSNDEYPDLTMKFSATELIEVLELNDLPRNSVVEIVVSGAVDGPAILEGSDVVILRQ